MRWVAMSFFGLMVTLSHAEKIDTISSESIDRRYLIDDILIVTHWRCSGSDGGVYIDFFERENYKPLASVRVLDCDAILQDGVDNIYKVGNEYLAPITFRYEDSSRPSLVVINSKDFTVKKRLTQANAFAEQYDIKRSEFNTTEDRLGDILVSVKYWNGIDYLVERTIGSSKVANNFTHQSSEPIEFLRLIDQNRAIFVTHSADNKFRSYYLTNIATNESKLLFKGPLFESGNKTITQVGFYSNFVVVNDRLVFSLGRDLISVTLATLEIQKIPELQLKGYGVDMNNIDYIMNDEKYSRLLIFCRHGFCNSYIPHSVLTSSPTIRSSGTAQKRAAP